jgi:hypothetical protein
MFGYKMWISLKIFDGYEWICMDMYGDPRWRSNPIQQVGYVPLEAHMQHTCERHVSVTGAVSGGLSGRQPRLALKGLNVCCTRRRKSEGRIIEHYRDNNDIKNALTSMATTPPCHAMLY